MIWLWFVASLASLIGLLMAGVVAFILLWGNPRDPGFYACKRKDAQP